MAQPLWYLRSAGQVLGPFPSPQVEEMLREGSIDAQCEISLDEIGWLPLAESGQFLKRPEPPPAVADPEKLAWEEQRQRARQRFESGVPEPLEAHDPALDEQRRQALERDQLGTDRLLQAQRGRRPSLWIPLLALLAIALASLVVWWGQNDQPIQTSLNQAVNCAAPAAEGVNWRACDLRGKGLAGTLLRNARLEKTRLDDARLAGAILEYANLHQASLRNADLRGAKLAAADLTGADLTGADLTGANLRHAVLTGAHLAGARLDQAIWSDGRTCGMDAIGACP